MERTSLSIRFDIDTLECVSGLPTLLAIGREFGVRFTFYANLGRSISLKKSLGDLFRSGRQSQGESYFKFPVSKKMSREHYVKTLLINPLLCRHDHRAWLALKASDHEIGLHGGRNHAQWQSSAQHWRADHLVREVSWGVDAFQKLFGVAPGSFASPGWNSPPDLPEVLRDAGFSYFADSHTQDGGGFIQREGLLPNANTNMLGMPGNIGFLEFALAKNPDAAAVLALFDDLLVSGEHNVVYDHPGFICRLGSDVLRRLLEHLARQNIEVITVREAVHG